MKKLITILILVSFYSCSNSVVDECECEKITYSYQDLSTPLFQEIDTYIISTESVECSEPAFKVLVTPLTNGGIYYNIECK